MSFFILGDFKHFTLLLKSLTFILLCIGDLDLDLDLPPEFDLSLLGDLAFLIFSVT